MLHIYGRNVVSEKIVFADHSKTELAYNGALLRRTTPAAEVANALKRRQGSSDWTLEVEETVVGEGGIAFHYNEPYADLYMNIKEPYRRRGLGAFFVQELKRHCREMRAVPCARCSPDNIASRRTPAKAGFAPFAHILLGQI